MTPLPIEQRNVGMVFQSYALFPNMSVAENIGYGLRVRGAAKDAATARAEMLDLVDIARSARRVDQLSGGQRQRVALARALASGRACCCSTSRSPRSTRSCARSCASRSTACCARLGITTIYVTHDQAEAMALGDRIVVMENGRIAQIGTPQEIYHRPATAFVAEFIGTMNRMGTRDAREVMFRPEDVRLVRAGEHDIAAKVISSFFLGDRTRLIVDARAATPLVVETTERRRWPRGETVYLCVADGALLAVPGARP